MSRTLEAGVSLLTAAEIRVVSSVVICVCISLHSSRSGLLARSQQLEQGLGRLSHRVVCGNTDWHWYCCALLLPAGGGVDWPHAS